MNINKDTKTPIGTTGFLTNFGTMKRLKANESYRVELSSFIYQQLNVFKELTEIEGYSGKFGCTSRKFCRFIQQTESSGISMHRHINAFQIGLKAMETFITKKLAEGNERSICDSIKWQKFATFQNLNKKKVTKT